MSDIQNKTKRVDVIPVVHEGEKLVIPESLTDAQAVEVLMRKMEYDEEDTQIFATIDCFVPDGAHALFQVLREKYGWVGSEPTPGFFGSRPPTMLTVVTGPHPEDLVQVPWGRIKLPGIEGYIETAVSQPSENAPAVFTIGGVVKRKHEQQVQAIVEAVKRYLANHSIYKGKAFSIRFHDDHGELLPMPEPKFFNLDTRVMDDLVFSEEVMDSVRINMFCHIKYTAQVRKAGVPLKRGILLSGPWGTGKSMTARAMAELCMDNGWTYIAAERADELAMVVKLSRLYGQSVVFCEDVDRVLDGQRSIDMDELLNIIDGVDSKGAELMVVLTTNHVERVNQAMLRPGRLDAVINVLPPDRVATEKLMHLYGRGLLLDGEDITKPTELMAGSIPSAIREAVERSKLAYIWAHPDQSPLVITGEALVAAAHSMRNQLDLLAVKAEDTRSNQEKAASILAEALGSANSLSQAFLADVVRTSVTAQVMRPEGLREVAQEIHTSATPSLPDTIIDL